ncbi:MAG: response regulator [Deltaproteobacteria bacterium]|nr:response regulator [Deltaproteobacteria bacterium]MBI3294261.1 response regulator [Deltaproteobacteria bacterium]
MPRAEILLVDDEPGDRLLIKNALNTTSWVKSVRTARNPLEAAQILYRTGPYAKVSLPNLIICDLHMPHGGGLSVLKSLKTHRKLRELPIVMFSTCAESSSIGDCYKMGAHIYLRKPTDVTTLVKMMEELGSFWTRVHAKAQLPLRKRMGIWWHDRKRDLLGLPKSSYSRSL